MKPKTLADIWRQVPADYFNRGIQTNLLQRAWHQGKFIAVFESTGLQKGKMLLEIGCADGSFAHRLGKKIGAKFVTAVDPYFPPLRYGKAQFGDIFFACTDAHHLPFADHSFDVITILETLEHVVSPYQVLVELKRIVKRNGVIIVELDSGSLLFRLIWAIWKMAGKGKVWRGAHLTFFNVSLLESLFVEAGLVVKQKKLFNLGMGVCFRLRR